MAYPLNLGKVVLNWTLPNSLQAQNVLHVSRSDVANLSISDCATIGTELADWYANANYNGETNASLRSWLTTFVTLNTIIVSDSGTGPTVQATTSVNLAGQAASSPLPNEAAMVSTWYTNQAGRRGRGRTFWPGMNASDMSTTDGTFSATFVAGMQDTLDALIGGINTTAYRLSVHSVAGGTFYNVQSVVARDTPHHQRRRNT